MKRRHFLFSLATPLAFRAAPRPQARISRIVIAPIEGRFHKFVAMNSYDVAPKGHTYANTLVRIVTDQGVEGVGVMSGSPRPEFLADLKTLVGADPVALYRWDGGRIVGRSSAFAPLLEKYKHLDGPLFDLAGKLTGKPCWKLIGDAVRERVEVYDGTLYFSDVWFKDRGVHAVVEEAEEAVRSGYLGMKFKVGRGWKWMEKQAGIQRDIDVLRAVRKAVGPKPKILADANNGYRDDFEGVWRLLSETKSANLYWMEEIFPENVEHYTRLRERMAKAGMKTLIADGESVSDPEAFEPYLRPRRLIDVLQMDIRRGGFLTNLETARLAQTAGAVHVPHNWASHVGLLMGLHLAKAVENVPAAEDDRSTCDAILTEGYSFHDGFYTVSDAPGLGIRVDEVVYGRKSRHKEIVVAS
jgi:D-galactarolactone cycloisomerase